MTDKEKRVVELYRQNFGCSQILLLLGLEALEQSNAGLIRAMSGLSGGVGSLGNLCGALTGGACLIGLYAGKGHAGEDEHDRFFLMIDELADWFVNMVGRQCGGITCVEIGDCSLALETPLLRCCSIITATWNKVEEILLKNRIHPGKKGSG